MGFLEAKLSPQNKEQGWQSHYNFPGSLYTVAVSTQGQQIWLTPSGLPNTLTSPGCTESMGVHCQIWYFVFQQQK